MPRRGRASGPPPRTVRQPAASMQRTSAPAKYAPAPTSVAPPAMAQPQQPSLMGQMAATAGGVAIGSAVGHTIGHAMTGMFSGGSNEAPASSAVASPSSNSAQPAGACAWEIKQFLECAQNQYELSSCEELNQLLRQCKASNGLAM
ncbi:coiled-coil-helix-coiled-coil-helix domain-containing protein 2 [Copidosoma floridanum]|uniref:coiled-coil-helix-coiled-coil-helix domain-containing protein 2 n=1 Tax=Copidosoma floridanum TaxID=29053 RepID=UPI0006C93DC0|nr:coiled-coil-helix-coiled-coil-helix domain-containing protein 2 [Copidosoma floridanum]XP_014212022.1 coiled-coil-helix-coiled-coil-helix domain-containing protein 2 [Copidosoma floridanum]